MVKPKRASRQYSAAVITAGMVRLLHLETCCILFLCVVLLCIVLHSTNQLAKDNVFDCTQQDALQSSNGENEPAVWLVESG